MKTMEHYPGTNPVRKPGSIQLASFTSLLTSLRQFRNESFGQWKNRFWWIGFSWINCDIGNHESPSPIWQNVAAAGIHSYFNGLLSQEAMLNLKCVSQRATKMVDNCAKHGIVEVSRCILKSTRSTFIFIMIQKCHPCWQTCPIAIDCGQSSAPVVEACSCCHLLTRNDRN